MTDNQNKVNGFFLYNNQCDALLELPAEQALEVIRACRQFCAGDEPTIADPVVRCVFGIMKPSISVSIKKAQAGRKGGEANRKQIEADGSKTKQSEADTKQNQANGSNAKQTEANGSKLKQTEAKKNKNKKQEQEQEDINTPANPRFAGFVREYQTAVKERFGPSAPKVTEKLIAEGCVALEQAERIDGFDWEEMQAALFWAHEDTFWGQNVKSLAQIRKKGSDDTSKLQKIMERYRQRRPEEKPFWDRPGVL